MAGKPSLWSRLRSLVGQEAPKSTPAPEVAQTQPPTPVQVRPDDTLDLTIGLDFGTSCSKVVIGDPDWQAQSFAVSFESPATELRHWLFPTRFGQERDLKWRLMAKPDCGEIQNLVALYIAEVVRQSQAWFAQNAPAGYKRRKVNWSLVIGFPEKEFTDSPLSRSYRTSANLAVRLAGLDASLSTEVAQRVRDAADTFAPVLPDNRIHFYPEIAAQLAGYINSPFRQPGSLLLIDVGAGTMDVSTLIVHGNAEQDVISFHVCEVKPLGALRLLDRQITALRSLPGIRLKVELLDFQDTLRPVPGRVLDIIANNSTAAQRSFDQASEQFAEEAMSSALSCLTRFRMSQREVHANANFDPWGDNLRFFLTGGGARSEFFRRYLADGPLEQELARNHTRWHPEERERRRLRQGFRVERLPLPDNLLFFPKNLHPEFDRISVAHGLAFGGPNLMKITRSPLA